MTEPSDEKGAAPPPPKTVRGREGRRALLAGLPPLRYEGRSLEEAALADDDGQLAELLDLDADGILAPLWEMVHGQPGRR